MRPTATASGTIADGDAWLSREVPKILASSAYLHGGALFVLWDEGENNGDDPPFFVVSPNAKAGSTSQTAYDTSSYLKTVEAALGAKTNRPQRSRHRLGEAVLRHLVDAAFGAAAADIL